MADKINDIFKIAINEAAGKIKRESKKIILRLVLVWVFWLLLVIALFYLIGGWISMAIAAVSAIGLIIFCVASLLVKTKIAATKIALELPLDITRRLLTEIMKETQIEPEAAANIERGVAEIINNPIRLIRSPRKAADAAKEILNVMNSITGNTKQY